MTHPPNPTRASLIAKLVVLPLVLVTQTMLMGQKASDGAQVTQAPRSPLFKSTVRRVVVDVVVRDAAGKSLRGLTPKDFSVFEDGKPQHILSFDVYDLDKPSVSLPPDPPAMPLNTFVNIPKAPERGPLYLILYDMVNMDVDDQIPARQQVLKFIDSKPEGTRFAIWVRSDELHLAQGFTTDKKLLYAALDPKHPGPHVPMSFLLSGSYGKGDKRSAVSILTYLAACLNGLPGRKNLIWMAGQFPLMLYPDPSDAWDLHDEIKRQLNELTRAQVAVYPVNIRGLVTNPEGALTGARPYGGAHALDPVPGMPAQVGTVGGAGDRASADIMAATMLQGSGTSLSVGHMVQNDVATATGGRAFYNDNDLRAALDEATENGANYYSLTYSPTNSNYNGSLRNIRVSLARPNCQLQYRRSYYADDPYTPTARQTKPSADDDDTAEQFAVNAHERPLYAGLQHGAPLVHQLIFKVRIHAVGNPNPATDEQLAKLATQPAYFRGKNKKPHLPKDVRIQKYAIYYALSAAQIKRSKENALPLEFAAVGFDSEGAALNGVFEVAAEESSNGLSVQEGSPTENVKAQPVYRAMQELFLPAGATSVRAAVRDLATDRVGAIEISLPIAPEVESAQSPLPQAAKPN